ncbi:unnamed protein product [Spirodela intermedia]|uniref:Uncharacterized protein n=1 Tax=Spirodela intermedia TaxID=51605 RepID=A0A7I8JKT2_SPIIN|nr:unnamed protein product [Spirodela intermedia]CAA6670797.1 unnamed protein product [Spirodela intermedia]
MGKEKAGATAAWRIIPRPLLESVLNNHAQHHRVHQPLFLHGPRGVGKTSLILHRLLDDWNKGPHVTGYVDFGLADGRDGHPSKPWASWSTACQPCGLSSLRAHLERTLESMVERGVRLGTIGGRDIFTTLNKWHGLHSALRRAIGQRGGERKDEKLPISVLWSRAVLAFSSKIDNKDIEASLGESLLSNSSNTVEELSYIREAVVSLRLAKEVIDIHQLWRREAPTQPLTGPACLLELLSNAAEIDYFQPKLVINNIEVLRKAVAEDDSTVSAAVYHDNFLWRLVALGINERSLPIILVTSDSYYSYQAYVDFGFPDIFISRETFGWTLQEAKLHVVPQFFSQSEWKVIDEVLGPNPRHLSDLHALKQRSCCQELTDDGWNNFEDIVDAYLAYLQVTVVNPAMESALDILKKFVDDVRNGKVPDRRLHFGAPWRHPPRSNDPPNLCCGQKLISWILFTDYSLEILDDPSAVAMLEVGLLYAQRDPSFIRPISRGIQRCLVRWLVQEQLQMGFSERMIFKWHRFIRGRSYRHLLKEVGYK